MEVKGQLSSETVVQGVDHPDRCLNSKSSPSHPKGVNMSIMQELEEAMKEKAAAEERVQELRGRARKEGLDQIRKIVKELELTAQDLATLTPGTGTSKLRKARKPAEFWYRNPVDASKVWKGSGPKPTWLKEMSAEAQERCKVRAE